MQSFRFVLRVALLAAVFVLFTACSSKSGGDDVPFDQRGKPPLKEKPASTVGGFSIEVPTTTVQPGTEAFPCMIFPIDLQGPSHVVGGASLTVTKGMHHGNITTRPKTGEGIRKCPDGNDPTNNEGFDVINGGQVLFASSTQIVGTEWQSLPPGMGYTVKDGYEIVARMHYLNPTSAPLDVSAKYEWFTIDPATLTQPVAPFFWSYKNFQIPPLQTYTVTANCRVPKPMKLVNVLPHMHALGTELDASFLGGANDGTAFLKSPGYDPNNGVIRQYDPAIDLSQGDGVSFSCTWNNHFDKVIVEGTGDNEMCMVFGYAYPPDSSYTLFATDSDPDHCLAVATPGQ